MTTKNLAPSAPTRLAEPWIELCFQLSKACSPVGMQMCLRSRHAFPELRRWQARFRRRDIGLRSPK